MNGGTMASLVLAVLLIIISVSISSIKYACPIINATITTTSNTATTQVPEPRCNIAATATPMLLLIGGVLLALLAIVREFRRVW
ncbi:MAG: hypothetical protein QW680_11615 [Pyrobaculum sp.]